MPSITLEIPADVVRALDRQARALLLSRRTYVRAVIAAVAAQAERESSTQPLLGARQESEAQARYLASENDR
jgi:hypothetical protein